MAVFSFEGGELRPAAPQTDLPDSVVGPILAALRENALEILPSPLFAIAWTRDPETPSYLICLDATGQICTVAVMPSLDTESLVAALTVSGRQSNLDREEIVRMYPGGEEEFSRKWNAFRAINPPVATAGPKLFVITLRVADSVRDAITALAGGGVAVYAASVYEAGGRALVNIDEVSVAPSLRYALTSPAAAARPGIGESASTPATESLREVYVELPAEPSAGTPAETYVGTPAKTYAGMPDETYPGTPAETPADAPAETTAPTYAGTVSEMPGETYPETYSGTPAETYGGTPAETYGGTPAETYGGTPAETYSGTSARTSAQYSGQVPRESTPLNFSESAAKTTPESAAWKASAAATAPARSTRENAGQETWAAGPGRSVQESAAWEASAPAPNPALAADLSAAADLSPAADLSSPADSVPDAASARSTWESAAWEASATASASTWESAAWEASARAETHPETHTETWAEPRPETRAEPWVPPLRQNIVDAHSVSSPERLPVTPAQPETGSAHSAPKLVQTAWVAPSAAEVGAQPADSLPEHERAIPDPLRAGPEPAAATFTVDVDPDIEIARARRRARRAAVESASEAASSRYNSEPSRPPTVGSPARPEPSRHQENQEHQPVTIADLAQRAKGRGERSRRTTDHVALAEGPIAEKFGIIPLTDSKQAAEQARERNRKAIARLARISQNGPVRVYWVFRRRGIDLQANVEWPGVLRVAGHGNYTDPTAAAEEIGGVENVDGWDLWRTADGRSLADLDPE
ncbi:Uncharacterised protein [Actinobaculum suis]|uniref:RAMA domain-containing protein n=1 Tax=Actinobaculum suis TaxID=1657 RepID=A0A7Z8YA41_9ACTO|nr:hypothetical protein [Actinobaculum suis]VDG77162.1 Uncharacterised protein [Actinobaculum suis]